MYILNNIKRSASVRFIKRHWLKMFIVLSFSTITVICGLSWKFNLELARLNDVISHQLPNFRKIVPTSTDKLRMKDTWRTPDVKNSRIFSAYLDFRPEVVLEEVPNASSENVRALIRIIAIIAVKSEGLPLTCYYEFPPNTTIDTSNKATILESPAITSRLIASTENFGMPYSAAFVLCKLITTQDGRLPAKITFSSESGKSLRGLEKVDFVDIHYTTRFDNSQQNQFMAVCVPSLHHGYDKRDNLIEFIEFYRMMGVEHFTFYNSSVTKDVSQVLKYYEDLNIATIIDWKLPAHYVFERTLRYDGIFAAMNDCLYRNMMVKGTRYVVNVDLDEFIVPRQHADFREMMKYLDPHSDENKSAVFLFRNIFFYLMHEDSTIPQSQPDIPNMLLHTKTTRWVRTNPAYDRSKYIVKGQRVVELGNHRVWHIRKTSLVFRTSYKEKIVDPSIAGSHHYRYCEVNELVCWLRDTIKDLTAHKFTNKLGARIANIFTEMNRKDKAET